MLGGEIFGSKQFMTQRLEWSRDLAFTRLVTKSERPDLIIGLVMSRPCNYILVPTIFFKFRLLKSRTVKPPWAQWACRVLFLLTKSTSQHRAQTLAVVWRVLFSVTDITNSPAEPHLKATRRIIGDQIKLNTANRLHFPHKHKVFDKHNS